MTWCLLYIIPAVCFGIYNAYLIDKWVDWNAGKRIRHGLNGLVHGGAALIGYIIFDNGSHFYISHYPVYWQGLKASLIILLIARVFFDTALNLFRDPSLGIGYVSKHPKSLIDKAEKKLFGNNGVIPKILYVFFIIILLTVK